MSGLNFGPSLVSFGGGDLVACESVGITFEDGSQTIHSARTGRPIGDTRGKRAGTISITLNLSELGQERPFLDKWERGSFEEARAKVPGGLVIAIEGRLTGPGLNWSQGAPTSQTIQIKGNWTFSQ